MNDELLVVTTRQEDNVHVVRARGEVDMSTAPLLEEALSVACDAAGPHASVVVDLAAVTFFGTTGLGVLVATLGRCQALRIPLRLTAPGPAVLRQLSAVGLDRVFDLRLPDCRWPRRLNHSAGRCRPGTSAAWHRPESAAAAAWTCSSTLGACERR